MAALGEKLRPLNDEEIEELTATKPESARKPGQESGSPTPAPKSSGKVAFIRMKPDGVEILLAGILLAAILFSGLLFLAVKIPSISSVAAQRAPLFTHRFAVVMTVVTLIFVALDVGFLLILAIDHFGPRWKERWKRRQELYRERAKKYESLRNDLEKRAANTFDCVAVYDDDERKKGFRGVGLITYKVVLVSDGKFWTLRKPELAQEELRLLSYESIESFTLKQLASLGKTLESLTSERTLEQQRILRKIKKLIENPDQYLQDEETRADRTQKIEAEIKLGTVNNEPLKITTQRASSSTSSGGGLGIFVFTLLLTGLVYLVLSSALRNVLGISITSGVAVAILIALNIYLIPSYVAFERDHPSRVGIFVLNLFLGVSVIGWIIALVWALSDNR
jgi:hypothetical protein